MHSHSQEIDGCHVRVSRTQQLPRDENETKNKTLDKIRYIGVCPGRVAAELS